MKDNWKLVKTYTVYRDPVLQVEHRDFHFKKNGQTGRFTVVSMKDWAVIVPVTKDGNFVLVRQFRVGTGEAAHEFPGGALETGEEPVDGAARELAEETGYSGRLTLLCRMRPNPAFMDNFCYVYLAEECVRTQQLVLDPFEDLEPEEFSEERLEKMLLDGGVPHSISVAAYGAYRAFLRHK